MGYVRTAGMSTAARRRRRRTAMVLTGLVLLLLAVFGIAFAFVQGWLGNGDGGTSDDTAITSSAPTLQPSDITVNVYNNAGVAGLAGRTAQALEARGFEVDSVADDTEDVDITHAADIRHGPAGLEAARLLQEQIPGAELVADERESDEIDLALGDAFEELPDLAEQTGGDDGEDNGEDNGGDNGGGEGSDG